MFLREQKFQYKKILYQCDIDEESVLKVKSRTMQILIYTFDGIITLDMHMQELVKLDIPVHLPKLVFKGKF